MGQILGKRRETFFSLCVIKLMILGGLKLDINVISGFFYFILFFGGGGFEHIYLHDATDFERHRPDVECGVAGFGFRLLFG